MEYIDYIICLSLGFYCGYKVAEAVVMWLTVKALKEIGIDERKLHEMLGQLQGQNPAASTNQIAAESEQELPKVAIWIEQQDAILYAYRKDTGQFLGQATSQEALIERLGEKMRNVKLIVAREDGGELMGGHNWQYDTDKKEFKKAD